jgi:Domain of unknown function (DUF6938)
MNKKKKAWVVSVNMGYGHQRTAYPLRHLAPKGRIINANDYEGILEKDRNFWESSRRFYEFISRFKRIPLVGEVIFSIYNSFQEIPAYYPKRDLSKPNMSLKQIFSLIEKGWGEHFISKLSKMKMPLITTFFIPAFMAEYFKYPEEIYCIICDADISRAWASLSPKKSRIKYLASNSWTANRLKLYGVSPKNIFLTGYPLPLENIGTKKQNVLKKDLGQRIFNLDPEGMFYKQYKPLIKKYIGSMPKKSEHVFTILFSIGGAGAQAEIVEKYLKSLKEKIKNKELRVFIGAGIRKEVKDYFWEAIGRLGLRDNLDDNIEVIFENDINNYFARFDEKIKETDILWTKPSELSFYSGLGVPIIIAPSIGSQEDYNKRWLLSLGAGIMQEDPKYANQWIYDYLRSGRFAEAALGGHIEVESMGVYNIEKVVFKK